MTDSADTILEQALELSEIERAIVAEKLLFSIENPKLNIEDIWAKEADARVDAYHKGDIESISAEEVFARYRNR